MLHETCKRFLGLDADPGGYAAWGLSDPNRGSDPELGFEGVDYLGTPEALDEFFTEEACRALGDHSRSIGLEPNVFVFQDASWNDACSEKREDSVRHFEKAAQAAKWIGCRIVSTLVPMPCGATPGSSTPPHRRSSRDTICPPTTATRRTGIP